MGCVQEDMSSERIDGGFSVRCDLDGRFVFLKTISENVNTISVFVENSLHERELCWFVKYGSKSFSRIVYGDVLRDKEQGDVGSITKVSHLRPLQAYPKGDVQPKKLEEGAVLYLTLEVPGDSLPLNASTILKTWRFVLPKKGGEFIGQRQIDER